MSSATCSDQTSNAQGRGLTANTSPNRMGESLAGDFGGSDGLVAVENSGRWRASLAMGGST
jgi:hypothetical protein